MMQAQTCALASVTEGLSVITERVYPSRFMHVPELLRMGAHISIEGSSATFVEQKVTGAPVMASDLRASAALILAGLGRRNLGTKNLPFRSRVRKFEHKLKNLEQKLKDYQNLNCPNPFPNQVINIYATR